MREAYAPSLLLYHSLPLIFVLGASSLAGAMDRGKRPREESLEAGGLLPRLVPTCAVRGNYFNHFEIEFDLC